MLTSRQIDLVQTSFAVITPIADDAAALFYRRLFALDPALEHMFAGDMAKQRRMLMQMLSAAVKGLTRLDSTGSDRRRPRTTARRIRRRGCTLRHRRHSPHLDARKGLGGAFTPEMRDAWTTVYGLLATTMKNAAAKERCAA